MPDETTVSNDKKQQVRKEIEIKLLDKADKAFQDLKQFAGDIFSLEVKLIDSKSNKEFASWKQYIDGDMEIKMPIDEEASDQAIKTFNNIVTQAMETRKKFLELAANLIGLGKYLAL